MKKIAASANNNAKNQDQIIEKDDMADSGEVGNDGKEHSQIVEQKGDQKDLI